MKKFKIIDLGISTGLILFFTIYVLVKAKGEIFGDRIFTAYFIIGGWQVISMLVHAVTKTFTYKWGIRLIYHWITFVALIAIPAGSFWILLFTAPFMALFYTWLCYDEIVNKMKRPLAQLK
jgi:hypothetical protein